MQLRGTQSFIRNDFCLCLMNHNKNARFEEVDVIIRSSLIKIASQQREIFITIQNFTIISTTQRNQQDNKEIKKRF